VFTSSLLSGGHAVVPYSGNGTVQQLATAVQAATSGLVTATANADHSGYRYTTMTARESELLGSAYYVYFGIKADISYYGIADDNLLADIASADTRMSQVAGYIAGYTARFAEVKSDFAAEDVVENKELWMSRMADREDGPCVRITGTKKQLLKKKRARTPW
jgi:hypothetical protein